MTLEATFQQLCSRIADLGEYLNQLRVTIVEDKPLQGDKALIDQLSDATYDVRGPLEEAHEFADEARRASMSTPTNLEGARKALAACQEKIISALSNYLELVSYERVAELMSMGQELGREGRAWARSVKSAFDECRAMINEINLSLLASWLDLTERVPMSSVSVQTTNIGQQISVPEGSEIAHGGIT